jgi:toxin ParE1/3/4
LLDIARFTQNKWSQNQAVKYVRELRAACELLASRPSLGRAVHKDHPKLRRMEVASHVVFYRADSIGIFVQRILHKNMMPNL